MESPLSQARFCCSALVPDMSLAISAPPRPWLVALPDWSARLAITTCFGLLGFTFVGDIWRILQSPVEALMLTRLAADCSVLMFYVMIVCLALTRLAPVAKLPGLLPRIEALIGTFLLFALPLVAARQDTVAANLTSSCLIAAGDGLAVYALSHLGRCFGIAPEARGLVMDGPYRLVRHPVYLAEEIALCGLFVQFASWSAALLLAVQIFFQIRRMLNEEAVLTLAFPEYAGYMKRTARLIPATW